MMCMRKESTVLVREVRGNKKRWQRRRIAWIREAIPVFWPVNTWGIHCLFRRLLSAGSPGMLHCLRRQWPSLKDAHPHWSPSKRASRGAPGYGVNTLLVWKPRIRIWGTKQTWTWTSPMLAAWGPGYMTWLFQIIFLRAKMRRRLHLQRQNLGRSDTSEE